ncbi:4-hydroxythreonine-4-phosphate dehydrogenase PdxA [Zhihengliuella salsuginis]|uniref:4-hydroxythreonine-4-phosphate dehydrogenase n=1 Tax=Zhihengliuella salsuginis TaxID=578222 RepID=A0ABQ3GIM9_9MICC|nr:4-hydroxythreonine-4-phosphate dehydrogenase PdxA [Zhihengliuella salsuginis]GHD06078.1 hypothetical protein GCM10008096_15630 [Zhihengliuella salsuginis]
MQPALVLADDFTGAAECAAQWAEAGYSTSIRLDGSAAAEPGVVVLDLDTRGLEPRAAAARVESALGRGTTAEPGLVFKKLDSLWRGNVAAELRALAGRGLTVLVAGALPELGRSVVDGVPLVRGVPLAETDLWAVEDSTTPGSVPGLFATDDDVATIGLATVRAGAEALAAALGDEARTREGAVVVLDCATAADLGSIADAAADLAREAPVALAGTGGLAAVLARRGSPPGRPRGRRSSTSARARPALVVIGSASAAARQQCAALSARGLTIRTGGEAREAVADLEERGIAVLGAPDAAADPARVLEELDAAAAAVLAAAPDADLVLTGGETARRILTRAGVVVLRPLGQIEHGVVLCGTGDGRRVITKPGSFGSPRVLQDALDELCAERAITETGDDMTTATEDRRPNIAVTMGDGAGVGPEVTVGALLDPRAYRESRPVVVGDAARLRLGAEALGVEAEIVEVAGVDEAVFEAGRINVVDPHLLPADLAWGRESAEAGNAAYHYIRIACELGMKGDVQGICTAPLNKAALHSAGHVYPGHTELLAHFMGIEEVSMMLSTPKLRVIHVTTHIGLVDAIARIEPGLVERTVRRGEEALRRSGIERPRVGVCAINPHAGENGLFGYGEEAEKIEPALEVLRAEGMDVAGPLPADTAFFLAGRGDYDLIVAMYHDQGHGPVKVLGIEAGVNITVGLPVIRTSVDHGTAFDIAGTGVVEVGSMIEALHQAANLSPSPVA